jgi:hypothetical protein
MCQVITLAICVDSKSQKRKHNKIKFNQRPDNPLYQLNSRNSNPKEVETLNS